MEAVMTTHGIRAGLSVSTRRTLGLPIRTTHVLRDAIHAVISAQSDKLDANGLNTLKSLAETCDRVDERFSDGGYAVIGNPNAQRTVTNQDIAEMFAGSHGKRLGFGLVDANDFIADVLYNAHGEVND
jgi:hypothetical protein